MFKQEDVSMNIYKIRYIPLNKFKINNVCMSETEREREREIFLFFCFS